MIAPIKRKSLPAIAKSVGLPNGQALHHFLTESLWNVEAVRYQRLSLILNQLQGQQIVLVIDDTGDRKKGKTTNYVERQYIGNLGKIENGIVSVNAYGVWKNMTFPLLFKVFKPKTLLNPGDIYQTKLQLAQQIIEELVEFGFQFSLVLADSLYGESHPFLHLLDRLELPWIVAIRSNHRAWIRDILPVSYSAWNPFERKFSDGTTEKRYWRETIVGKRSVWQYWTITTDPKTVPVNSTWLLMSHIPESLKNSLGNLYGMRTWIRPFAKVDVKIG